MRGTHTASLMRRLASELEAGTLVSSRDRRGSDVLRGRRRFTLGPVASALSQAWASLADPVRYARLPAGARVVGIGGATLGGSGKTPLVLALAQALAVRGTPVAVVASGYRCRLKSARRVRTDDRARVVGDEALWLCRALSSHDVPVVCGPERNAALEHAAKLARVVIVDGLLQARPRRLALSILALDGARPWGASRCPPAGDLRARRERLLDAADLSVLVGPPRSTSIESEPALDYRVPSTLLGACSLRGQRFSIDRLRSMRLGVVLGVARPERILDTLLEHGIEPCTTRLFGDHSPLTRMGKPSERLTPEAWLTTAKCATKLAERLDGAPVFALDHRLTVPDALLQRVVESC